jgi:predicted glycoside hydrolase/deacetylase ChbG (UPF0249 family)
MVRWPAAGEAAGYARRHPELSVGLHFDLGEWAYREETWVPLYQVVPVDDVKTVRQEVAGQVATFRRLVGKDPTHIDSHQDVHLREPVRSVVSEIARNLAVPVRQISPAIRRCGDFYGQTAEGSPLPDAIRVEGLMKILAALPPGLTELACHPGDGNDLASTYLCERPEEVKVLCDPRVRAAIAARGINLCSFNDFACRMDERK